MEFSEQVLVLHIGKFKETDMWVRFLSPSRGVLSAFAFGGSRSKKRFVGCLDVFNQVLFRVESSHRGAYLCLQEGVLMKGTNRLRSDWQRLGIANNCGKFLQAFGITAEGSLKAHSLFIEVLQVLEENDTIPQLLPIFFRLRLSFDQGYSIGLRTCTLCNCLLQESSAHFHVRDGHLLCSSCARIRGERTVVLSNNALVALQCIGECSPQQWCSLHFAGTDKNDIARAIDSFIQFHVGLLWENGRFLRL